MKLHNTTSTIQSLTLITVTVSEKILSSLKRLHKDKETHTHMHAPPPHKQPIENPIQEWSQHGKYLQMWEVEGGTQTLPQENHQLLCFCKPWEHMVLNTSLILLLPLMSYRVSPSILSSSEGKSKTNKHCGQRTRKSKTNKHCGLRTGKSKTNKHCGQSQTPGKDHHHYNEKCPKYQPNAKHRRQLQSSS